MHTEDSRAHGKIRYRTLSKAEGGILVEIEGFSIPTKIIKASKSKTKQASKQEPLEFPNTQFENQYYKGCVGGEL